MTNQIEQALKHLEKWLNDNDKTKLNEWRSHMVKEAFIGGYKSSLEALEKCEPVGWQFYQDGKWHNGMDTNNHKQNTIDAGFPVRDIFTSLQPIEKCEPVAKLGRWKIDKSTGTEILTLDNCSVIEGKYAHYIMGLLQKEIDKVVSELENTSPQSRECEDWQYFDKAYKKATESSEPDDWMNAALLAQQVRRIQLNAKG